MFANILRSRARSADLKEQAIWALGNVSGDSAEARDSVLISDALNPLIALVDFGVNSSMSRAAVRTLSILCCVKPPPPFEQVQPVLNIFCRLTYLDDEEILTAVCKALACISAFTMDRIMDSVLIFMNVLPRLLQLLEYPSNKVCIPALRTLGNLVTGDNTQTQRVLDEGFLSYLHNFLEHSNRIIRKETCWIISNITAGNRHQIQAVIDCKIIDRLVDIAETLDDLEIKKEAVWAMSNAVLGGSRKQIQSRELDKCIAPFCVFLDNPDPKTVMMCLKALEKFLKVGEGHGYNSYVEKIEDLDGWRNMMNMRTHDNTEINTKTVNILRTYWDLNM
ncbi:hypothetical protein Ddye_028129 [Dipteronia dyeriana]|uniref:Uncharacterized protein n=1 Tax=Dipteronia dyeriana TaxID=168575 RepID=A0AAD9WQV6_9ROSI|nr:hypothetical protein Ddye_028129 [Dipteronia dyeriana]